MLRWHLPQHMYVGLCSWRDTKKGQMWSRCSELRLRVEIMASWKFGILVSYILPPH